jgi:hypothetical protein
MKNEELDGFKKEKNDSGRCARRVKYCPWEGNYINGCPLIRNIPFLNFIS